MAVEKISGPQKAAIFIYAIGEELASEIVKKLDEGEIKKLGGSMAKITTVAPTLLDSILKEFNDLVSSGTQPMTIGQGGGSQFIQNVLSKSVEEGKAQTLMEEIKEAGQWNLFQKIKKLDAKTIGNFIKGEHPQTISIILAHLDSGLAAGVLSELPGPLQTEVVFRIAELENVPSNILEEIDQALQEGISLVENSKSNKVGGIRSVAEILNSMDSTVENAIMKGIEEQKPDLADEIRKLMFTFEDLLQVDDRGIMAILKEVNNEALQLALKTASEDLKAKIFKNMSERAAQMMKEDLEVMGPVRLKDVELAQQSLIKVAKKLESEGKVVLSGKGKEDVFV
ncbi:MAG: flagellar motor switch protein FliG [Deltaproteobacteria bacterium]|nr:flagellar motor switch protein FliG [Deltaproteobacteria bacterium]